MNFWDDLPRPFFALAPMEDVTDVAFRLTVLRADEIAERDRASGQSVWPISPNVLFTEFTNAASFCSEKGEFSTRGRLTFDVDEQPIVAQIWGKNPENFYQMSRALAEKGFSGIDINMGCPVKDVVKSGGGSALIENPDLAVELIKAAQKSTLPVSVKTRLAARDLDEWSSWLTTLLEQNLANLIVHLRTRKEMSKVPAHFELIPEILQLRNEIAPQTKITINGDIRNRAHALELYEKHPEIDGFMIGRGVFANPFCFTNLQDPSREQLFELFNFHLDQFDKWREIAPNLHRKFDPLKRFFKIYVRDFTGAAELRAELFNCKTIDEVRAILTEFEKSA